MTTLAQRMLLWLGAILIALVTVLPTFVRMPDWWPATARVRLGLDLRGGTHLLYSVDLDEAVAVRMDAVGREIEQVLREEQTGAFTVDASVDGLTVRLANASKRAAARSRIQELFTAFEVKEDGRNGLTLTLSERDRQDLRRDAVEQALQILRNRIDEFGVAEPSITKQGADEIVIQLPGVQDPQRAKDLIGRTALLEFKMVADGPAAGTIDQPGAGIDVVTSIDGARYLIERKTIMTGNVVTDASVGRDIDGYYVSFVLDGRGAKLFGDTTRTNVNRLLAIILDGQVQTAPVIKEPITGGRGQISGNYAVEEAQDLANVLRNGALPAPLVMLEERTVGPSLGRDSIRQGSFSFLVGGILVVLFMGIYYRGGGVVADVALVANVLMVLAMFAIFGFTLTLPGIAGIVLTVGMAVDANVLILERVREELREGRGGRAAIEAGYERAWSAILDSNVTTFVSGLILFQFGSGPVRGFAVTLCIGIVTSVLTAVWGTRVVYDWLGANRRLDVLSV